MQKISKLAVSIIVTTLVSGVVGGVFGAVGVLTTDHFILANAVERINSVEKGKLDISTYDANIEPIRRDITEMKADIKTLLSRRQVYLDVETNTR
jgi:hypothetical protein